MICRVCGKVYVACRTPNPYGTFRWFDVACSRECAQIYLEEVQRARGEVATADAPEETVEDTNELSVATDEPEIPEIPFSEDSWFDKEEEAGQEIE